MPDEEKCSLETCDKPARMAVTTRRDTRTRNVISTVYYDNRTAPKKAQRYCRKDGAELLKELVKTLSDEDE